MKYHASDENDVNEFIIRMKKKLVKLQVEDLAQH
jgi:hypothetical protein